jgi:hypothetical protein
MDPASSALASSIVLEACKAAYGDLPDAYERWTGVAFSEVKGIYAYVDIAFVGLHGVKFSH